jgi:hypothetical protein
MRAADILPDHADHAVFDGLAIRKGTIAAFLANARTWLDAATPPAERTAAEREIVSALPALQALGLFEVLAPRDARLQALVERRPAPDRS